MLLEEEGGRNGPRCYPKTPKELRLQRCSAGAGEFRASPGVSGFLLRGKAAAALAFLLWRKAKSRLGTTPTAPETPSEPPAPLPSQLQTFPGGVWCRAPPWNNRGQRCEILPLRAFFRERPQSEERRSAIGAGRRRARRMRSLEQAAGSTPGCSRREGRHDGVAGCGGSLIRGRFPIGLLK